jgi:CHAT domain-containing protein/tetratricopeptide (TPR) repeat protein
MELQRMRSTLCLALLLTLTVIVCEGQQWKADYNQAQKEYEANNYDKALQLADLALSSYLKEGDASIDNQSAILRLLQNVLYQRNEFHKALEYANREAALRGQKQDVLYAGALLQKGTFHQALEEYGEAESTFLKAYGILQQFYQSSDPALFEPRLNIGIARYLSGNTSGAQIIFEETLASPPQEVSTVYLQALYYHGLIALANKNYTKALQAFVQAEEIYQSAGLDQSAEFATLLVNIGKCQYEIKQYAEAEKYFGRATQFYGKLNDKGADYLALLNARSLNFHALGQDDKANALAKEINSSDSDPVSASIFLSNKAVNAASRGDVKAAEDFYKQAIAKLSKDDIAHESTYANVVQNLAVLYAETARPEEALRLLADLKSKFVNKPQAVGIEINFGNVSSQIGDLKKAQASFQYALSLIRNQQTPQDALRIRALTGLGLVYLKEGQVQRADSLYNALLTGYENGTHAIDQTYPVVLNNYAAVKQSNGEYYASRNFLQSAALLIRQQRGVLNLSYARALENLADVDLDLGSLTTARTEIDSAILVYEKLSGEKSIAYASALINRGKYFQQVGEYASAEPAFKKAFEVMSAANPSLADWVKAANALAVYYQTMGDYDHAMSLFTQIRKKLETSDARNSNDYSTNLQNLATLYQLQDKPESARPLLEEALNVDKKIFGTNHPQYLITLRNLAALYQKTGKLENARILLEQALSSTRNIFGEDHQEYASTLSNLASLYQDLKKMNEAEKAWLQSANLRKKIFGDQHPDYARSLYGLSNVYFAQGKLNEAKQNYSIVVTQYLKQIREYFPALSEKEKGAFYQKIKPVFDTYQDFCMQYHRENPSDAGILKDLYNIQLSTKAILLNTTNKVRQTILTSGDTALVNRFKSWLGEKERIVRYYTLSEEERKEFGNIQAVTQRANDIEKELSLKSSLFKSEFAQEQPTSTKIASALNDGEVAVEIIRVQRKFVADSVYYVGLMLRKNSDIPSVVVWPYGKKLENRLFRFHRNAIKYHYPDTLSFTNYWKPMSEKLAGSNRIFISADGVFNKINFNILQSFKTGRTVLEDYTLHLLSNTKELMERNASHGNGKNIHLYGFADFHLKLGADHVVHHTSKNVSRAFGFADEIPVLPGTDKEIREIGQLFSANQFNIVTYKLAEASEYNLKQTPNVKVLHIATHGFFMNDVEVTDTETQEFFSNPLLRSGILLSGAGVDKSEVDLKGEDGILTAYEAMNLELSETELVVLSACETALGELRNGEGVYGLQRSFIVAGASAVMMSLWQVDDAATQELMVAFYQNWLSGSTKHEAFRKAQLQIKEKYDSPFYWGAFILVGH